MTFGLTVLSFSSFFLLFPQQTKWTWGPDGEGAILLVNCDRDGPSSEDVDSTYPYVRSYAGTAEVVIYTK